MFELDKSPENEFDGEVDCVAHLDCTPDAVTVGCKDDDDDSVGSPVLLARGDIDGLFDTFEDFESSIDSDDDGEFEEEAVAELSVEADADSRLLRLEKADTDVDADLKLLPLEKRDADVDPVSEIDDVGEPGFVEV